MSVVIEKDFDAVGREAWDALAAASPMATPFQSWSWHGAWWRAYRDAASAPRELMLVCVREATGLRAVAPLMLERVGGRRVVTLIGGSRSDQSDILCAHDDDAARERIFAELQTRASEWDVLDLRRLPQGSPTVNAVRAWAARAGLAITWSEPSPRPSLRVRGSDPHVERIVADARSDAAKRGIRVRHTDDRAEIADRLNAFYVQHIHRWSSHERQSVFVDRASRDFYRDLVQTLDGEHAPLLTTLHADGETTAYHLGIASAKTLWWHESSSEIRRADEQLEDVLLRELIVHARTRGIERIELARSESAMRSRTAAGAEHTIDVRIEQRRPTNLVSRVRRAVTRNALVRRTRSLADEVRQVANVVINARRLVDTRRKAMAQASSHRDFYDTGSITTKYVHEQWLQKPEETILREMRPEIRGMRVLDVAVGAGRTVPYFGTEAREYRAFDYAMSMVDACRAIVGDLVDPGHVTCGDARDMRDYADGSFDFVLISYNGIDTVGDEADRLRVLAEVKRVAAPGGYLCFSSHNMGSLTPAGQGGPGSRLKRWRRYMLLRAANPGLGATRQGTRAMIYDAGSQYSFLHYYIAPSAQVRQLEEQGFRDVRVFSLDSGEELHDASRWDRVTDSWIYYLCRA